MIEENSRRELAINSDNNCKTIENGEEFYVVVTNDQFNTDIAVIGNVSLFKNYPNVIAVCKCFNYKIVDYVFYIQYDNKFNEIVLSLVLAGIQHNY